MREISSRNLILRLILLLILRLGNSECSTFTKIVVPNVLGTKNGILSPNISPNVDPQPYLPLLAPSPSMPVTNPAVPRFSGLCTLNFSAAETALTTTATDCWASFAAYTANVVCCPQLDATLAILIGQSSVNSQKLALNITHARHCLSDIELVLESRGGDVNLQKTCSVYPSNLTEGSCPVVDVSEVDSIVDSSILSSACENIDPVNECCNKLCQNAISDAAERIAMKSYSMTGLDRARALPEFSTTVGDCKNIVLRWLARKLNPSSANRVLRVLSSCNTNKVCPLSYPDIRNVSSECGNATSNQTSCCNAMEKYMSQLQDQSLITNLQALNCAAQLGSRLQQNANVSTDVYSLCRVRLKDFSLQVDDSQESGCLLPSLPLDLTYDTSSGISFTCDLDDNVAAASWPSDCCLPDDDSLFLCDRSTKSTAIPSSASAWIGILNQGMELSLLFTCLLAAVKPLLL